MLGFLTGFSLTGAIRVDFANRGSGRSRAPTLRARRTTWRLAAVFQRVPGGSAFECGSGSDLRCFLALAVAGVGGQVCVLHSPGREPPRSKGETPLVMSTCHWPVLDSEQELDRPINIRGEKRNEATGRYIVQSISGKSTQGRCSVKKLPEFGQARAANTAGRRCHETWTNHQEDYHTIRRIAKYLNNPVLLQQ